MVIQTLDIETSNLTPADSFISVVGLADETGIHQFSAPAESFRYDPEKAEKDLLTAASSAKFGTQKMLLSYNGRTFDIPFVTKRLEHHNIPAPEFLGITNHLDMFQFCKQLNGGTMISKDYVCSKFLDLYCPRGSSGAHLANIYSQQIVTDEQHAECLQHNAQDLAITMKMFYRFSAWPKFRTFYAKEFSEIIG